MYWYEWLWVIWGKQHSVVTDYYWLGISMQPQWSLDTTPMTNNITNVQPEMGPDMSDLPLAQWQPQQLHQQLPLCFRDVLPKPPSLAQSHELNVNPGCPPYSPALRPTILDVLVLPSCQVFRTKQNKFGLFHIYNCQTLPSHDPVDSSSVTYAIPCLDGAILWDPMQIIHFTLIKMKTHSCLGTGTGTMAPRSPKRAFGNCLKSLGVQISAQRTFRTLSGLQLIATWEIWAKHSQKTPLTGITPQSPSPFHFTIIVKTLVPRFTPSPTFRVCHYQQNIPLLKLIYSESSPCQKFQNKGFEHHTQMVVLVPHKIKSQGRHGYQLAKSGHKQAVANMGSTHLSKQPAITEQTSSMLNLHQLSAAINASLEDQGSSSFHSKDVNPNTIPPSIPSSYGAASSVTSNGTNITSISHGKRKADHMPSEVSESACKHFCAPTIATQVEMDGSAVMQDIATAFKDFLCTVADANKPSLKVPKTDLSQVVNILNQHTKLSVLNRLAISDYLTSNVNQAIVFCSMSDMEVWKVWLQVELQSMQ